MRILLVNWAKVWEGPARGGGVNAYAQSLALELTRAGHDVSWLCSGDTYVPVDPQGTPGTVALRRLDDWLGVRVFEVINSPVLAPSIHQFRRPMREISAPRLEAEIRAFARALQPDIVHFHNLEGLSTGCLDAFREPEADWPGARVLFSLHNYHTLCPQVYLMQGHRTPCRNYEHGHACTTCINAPYPADVRRKRFLSYLGHDTTPQPTPAPAPSTTFSLPGYDPTDLTTPRPLDPDTRGNTQAILHVLSPNPAPDPADTQPLTNDVLPEPPSDKPPNDYARRRHAMIDMLNRCDQVLAVSSFVERLYISRGVQPARITTMHIGTRATQIAARQAEMIFDPPPFDPPRPIRMAFMGFNNYFKGLPLLADTLEMLTPGELGRLDLTLAAPAIDTIEWRFRRLQPRLGALTIHPAYQPNDIPWLLGGKDLGIVPSVWWDNAPQTVFEFFSCRVPVLGAAVGGIPDFVIDGVNGLLFTANDRSHLAARLREILADPHQLAKLRHAVNPPTSIEDHTRALLAMYETLLERKQSPGKLH